MAVTLVYPSGAASCLNPEIMKESSRYNIRYVGFESLADGGRRFDYAVTAQGAPARSASIFIPAAAFAGAARVTFQESAIIGCEKVRRELEIEAELHSPITFTLAPEDIEQFRPRRRAAAKRS
jgi:hypothetical protein